MCQSSNRLIYGEQVLKALLVTRNLIQLGPLWAICLASQVTPSPAR